MALRTSTGSKSVCGMSQLRVGEAAMYSPSRSGPLPQERTRLNSSPATEVQKTVSPIMWCGTASAMTWSSMPMSRMVSIVRWLVMCARGVLAVLPYFEATTTSTP